MGKPKIRFKGFDNDWEQRKLGDVLADMYNGQTPSRNKAEFWNGEISWLSSGELNRGTVNSSLEKITEAGKKSANLRIVPKGTFIMAITGLEAAGTRGNCALLGLNTTLNQSCMALFPKKGILDSRFLFQWYRKVGEEYGTNYTQGTKQQSYNAELIKILPITLPNVDEQIKISLYLENLDHLITLHQRKCEDTKKLKKYMLQKMFPQNGSKVPEIRFKGFTDDWEQRKLGEIITEYKETVDSDCTLPILTSSKTEGVILQEEHFGRKQQHDITGYNILPRNYCTYRNRSDGVDFTFNINKCCDKGIISKFYPVFSGNNSDVFFLSLVLNNSEEVVHEIAYTCTGTGQKVLSFLDLQKMKVRVPGFDEQKKIAAYFDDLDHLITLHQNKCEELKKIKKYMLQNMFV